ncbi:MAG: hypothetical protein U9R16_07005 [Campylobacterota bacterium]|nr:hypothetical protein [Campylobacterota bacterium]
MASDLSELIQDVLCSTLNALLSKEAKLKEINKVHEKDLADIQTLKIDSTFEFKDITSTWSFIIPAYSSSYIFNTMLGEESEPVELLDDDIADAINEFISNVSGGLTTIINGSEFDDLGEVKSNTLLDKIIEKNQIEDIDNMYKLTIDLDGLDITIFILFDNPIIPFIKTITKSKISVYPEDEELENKEEEELENIELDEEKNKSNSETTEEKKEDLENKSKEKNSSSEEKTDDTNDDSSKDETELTDEEKKAKKLKKIIIGVAGALGFTIVTGVVMYFTGMFDPEPIKQIDTNATKIVKDKDNIDVIKYTKKKKTNFSTSKINKDRLNTRLALLTKYEILSEDEIEAQNIAQKERLYYIEREKELIAFAKLNKEERIYPKVIKEKEIVKKEKNNTKEQTKIVIKKEIVQNSQDLNISKTADIIKKEIVVPDTNDTKIVKIEDNRLKFILVDSLKYKLFKEAILKIDTKEARISICKDITGRTAVYIGPFEEEILQNKMLKILQDKETNLNIDISNITQEEFNARCNF